MVSTVGAILLFFVCLAMVGPTVTSLLGLVEPVVTVVAAAIVFGEALTLWQLAGGAVVLAAVGLVQWPVGPRTGSPPASMEEGSLSHPAPASTGVAPA